MPAVLVSLAVVAFFLYTVFTVEEVGSDTAAREASVAGVLNAIPLSRSSLTATGTIEYAPRSTGGEISYLVFLLPGGEVATKALTFTGRSECVTHSGAYPCVLIEDAFRFYFDEGPVEVEGEVVAEHILVSRLIQN